MIEVKRIFPECNADTLLIELLLERGKPAHYKGCSKVAKALENIDNDLLVFGIVDSDKFQNNPPYFEKFTVIIEDYVDNQGLLLKQIPNSNKRLIFVCPEFEQWIWQRAIDSQIDPSQFGLNSLPDLYAVSKGNEIREDANLKRFINAVVRSDNTAMQILRKWLSQVFNYS